MFFIQNIFYKKIKIYLRPIKSKGINGGMGRQLGCFLQGDFPQIRPYI